MVYRLRRLGRKVVRQRQVTNTMVNPEHWDVKAGDLKKRVLINEDVRQKLIEDLAVLKTYINKKYTDDKEAGKVKDNWLEKALKSHFRSQYPLIVSSQGPLVSEYAMWDSFQDTRQPNDVAASHCIH